MIAYMDPAQVVKHYGGDETKVALAAEALSVTRATIYNWLNAGKVPDLWQRYIELDTRGRLRRSKE